MDHRHLNYARRNYLRRNIKKPDIINVPLTDVSLALLIGVVEKYYDNLDFDHFPPYYLFRLEALHGHLVRVQKKLSKAD